MLVTIRYSEAYDHWSCYLDWPTITQQLPDPLQAAIGNGYQLAEALDRLAREQDPVWAERLLFDPEGLGTSCDARDPRDLVRAIKLLDNWFPVTIDWEAHYEMVSPEFIPISAAQTVRLWHGDNQHGRVGFWSSALVRHIQAKSGHHAVEMLAGDVESSQTRLLSYEPFSANQTGVGVEAEHVTELVSWVAVWNQRWPGIELLPRH